ncbi:MAG TPA: cupin domain-containing protein [Candidatus Dormibacteraeota bacterium]|nr:cupin domain-containing protein [Candidatus Dormibacteraeota bacterium]
MEQIEFLATAATTGGEMVKCRMRVAAGRPAPPEHSHPKLEERFIVEHGALGYILGTRRLEARSGDVVVVPAGQNHTFWNAGPGELSVVSEVRPALRFEDFVETIHVLIRDGRLQAGGKRPNPFLIAVVAMAYRDEWRLTRLSRAARLLLPALAFLGRRAGYRSRYPLDDERSTANIATTV